MFRNYEWFILIILVGCVEIFDGEFTSEGSDRIVITGGITNVDVPQVWIYKSVSFDDALRQPEHISDARVWIEDEEGIDTKWRNLSISERENFISSQILILIPMIQISGISSGILIRLFSRLI